MNRIELINLLRQGENSGVEFKRDRIKPEKLAERIIALLNLEGGHILLGVEDDSSVSGLDRESNQAEEWVMQIARDHIDPAVIPYWESYEWEPGKVIGIISLPANAPDKPYQTKHGITYIRVGTTTRRATREEVERLYQQSGKLRFGLKPVLGTTWESLDRRRLRDYFVRLLPGEPPPIENLEQWQKELQNLELMVVAAGRMTVTVDGVLLFGKNPGRFVPQSGIRAICYPSDNPDYVVQDEMDIKGPLVPLCDSDGSLVEPGVVDRAWDFISRNTISKARFRGARRYDSREYPEEAIREILVNALVHRDYSIAGTDVTLFIFSDRLEIQSPGRLPNTVTVDSIKSGMRYARNQTLVNVMRDYGYVEARGMGIRMKTIPSMRAHNDTEPEFIEEENSFTVRLWKEPPS